MIRPITTFPQAELPEFDICIIGSGPAGLALAHEMQSYAGSICVLESGGRDVDPVAQKLNRGRVTGDPYAPLQTSRRRQLGGTANMWGTELGSDERGTMYVPLEARDLQARPWQADTGWPFEFDVLRPYYERAQILCDGGPFSYGPEPWTTPEARPFAFEDALLKSSVYHFGVRTRFTQELLESVGRLANVTILTHATALHFERGLDEQRIESVLVGCAASSIRRRLRAGTFVLAAGGIENARLLLLSGATPEQAPGNKHGQVGRYFMDHPLVRCGVIVPDAGFEMQRLAFYDQRVAAGRRIMGKLGFSERALNEHKLLNTSIFLLPRGRWYGSRAASHGLKGLVRAAASGRPSKQTAHDLRQTLLGLPDLCLSGARKVAGIEPALPSIGRGGWSSRPGGDTGFRRVEVLQAVEQTPHPENRLMLDDRRDVFGLPRIRLHWEWRADDRERILRAQDLLRWALEQTGVGRVKLSRENGSPLLLDGSRHHHLGTTRMHADPRKGVVDANCRVHGTRNLFVAGSSVFPTGGYANPTLTLVALAIRLADHLNSL